MKKIVLRKDGQGWTDEFGNTWTLSDANKRPRPNLWTKGEEDLLREHLKSGGGFSLTKDDFLKLCEEEAQ